MLGVELIFKNLKKKIDVLHDFISVKFKEGQN